MRDLLSLRQVIDDVLSGFGIGSLDLFEAIDGEWEVLAGEPWVGHSRPVLLMDGELVVEARASAVSILRYAVGDLQRRLDARFGAGLVEYVRVRPASQSASSERRRAWE